MPGKTRCPKPRASLSRVIGCVLAIIGLIAFIIYWPKFHHPSKPLRTWEQWLSATTDEKEAHCQRLLDRNSGCPLSARRLMGLLDNAAVDIVSRQGKQLDDYEASLIHVVSNPGSKGP